MKTKLLYSILTLAFCFTMKAQLIQYDFSSGTETTNSGTEGAIGDLTFGGTQVYVAANNTVTATPMGNTVTFDATLTSTASTGAIANLPQGSTARTFTAWIKRPPSGVNRTMVSWGNVSTLQMFTFGFNNSGKLVASVSGAYKNTTQVITDDLWHHVAVTCPEGGSLSQAVIYIDGVAAPGAGGGTQWTNPLNTTGTTLYIGSKYGASEPLRRCSYL